MGSTRRAFTDEYKAHAVELVINDGRSIVDVARGIEVHAMTLGKWVKKAKDGGQTGETPLNVALKMTTTVFRNDADRDVGFGIRVLLPTVLVDLRGGISLKKGQSEGRCD